MDKWTMILLEAEDMWAVSAEEQSLSARGIAVEDYMRERDMYKARRIYNLYGEDYFLRFVERCPHIADFKEVMLNANK